MYLIPCPKTVRKIVILTTYTFCKSVCTFGFLKLTDLYTPSVRRPHKINDSREEIGLAIYVLPGLVNLANNKIVRLQRIVFKKSNRVV